jgi:hypothetical protein
MSEGPAIASSNLAVNERDTEKKPSSSGADLQQAPMGKEVILWCSSKSEAGLWTKIIRTKVSQRQIEIVDHSESCAGDIDRVTMACIIASAKKERACSEIVWLRGLSQLFSSSLISSPATGSDTAQSQLQQQQIVMSNLKLVEEKVDQLLKSSSAEQFTKALEANRLPVNGLVVVAMSLAPSSSSSLATSLLSHDSHRGNLSYFNGQYLSLWIQFDELNHRLVFYDHGPTNGPCISFSLSSETQVVIQDLTFEQNFLFELHNCSVLLTGDEGNPSSPTDTVSLPLTAASVNLSFSYPTALEYWKWALSFANFTQLCKGTKQYLSTELSLHSLSSKPSLPFSPPHPSSSSFISSHHHPLHFSRGTKWNNFMLDFAMDAINTITDRNMIRRFMKRHTVTGTEIRSIKFYSVHNRVIISDAGRTALRIGSVLITLNEISAIGIPGRSLADLIHEIPSHASVEILCWEFPREIFHCQISLPPPSAKKTVAAAPAAVDSWEEKKSNEKSTEHEQHSARPHCASEGASSWMTDVRMKLEGDSILFASTGGWKQTFLLANIRMRLIEIDEETSATAPAPSATPLTTSTCPKAHHPTVVALFVAIELRDKDSKVLISCSTLQVLLDLLCRIFEALKLFGTIGYDLTLFYERCLQYQLVQSKTSAAAAALHPSQFMDGGGEVSKETPISLTLSPSYQYLTPLKSSSSALLLPPTTLSRQTAPAVAAVTASRSDIMKAAHDLENVFENLHISDSFPTVKKIQEVGLSSRTWTERCVGPEFLGTSKY